MGSSPDLDTAKAQFKLAWAVLKARVNQWAFNFPEARVRPSDFAMVSTPTFAHQRSGGRLRRSIANGFFDSHLLSPSPRLSINPQSATVG